MGPDITDAAGNPLNQNGDALNGEATDAYSAQVYVAPTVWTPPSAPPELYHETFEAWSPAPPYWALESAGSGTIAAVTDGAPHGGGTHLLLDTDGAAPQSASVVVDLAAYAAAADLNLAFWAACLGGGTLAVDLSDDGTDASWRTVLSVSVPETYGNYFLDLDAQAAGQGIALDGDVYIRFRHDAAGFADSQLYLDDVRVLVGDVTGARVLAHTRPWTPERVAWWNSGVAPETLEPVLRIRYERPGASGIPIPMERFFPAETYLQAQEALLSHFDPPVRVLSATPGYFVPSLRRSVRTA